MEREVSELADKKVAVIMGSDSDLPVVKGAIDTLKGFGIGVEVHVMSAHRTPALACEFAASARDHGFAAIIAAAGDHRHAKRFRVWWPVRWLNWHFVN